MEKSVVKEYKESSKHNKWGNVNLMRVHQKKRYSHPENASRVRYICKLWTLDALSSALHHRLNSYKNIQEKCGFLSNLIELSTCQGHSSSIKGSGVLCKWFWRLFSVGIYSIFLAPQNCRWPRAEKNSQNTSTESDMLLLLNQYMCTQNFPNVHITLRIYLSMTTWNRSGEWSFHFFKWGLKLYGPTSTQLYSRVTWVPWLEKPLCLH